ncbi:Alcohol dehydrogenase superfamily, zinc-type [Akanthomyces lecanii RCEF 1005]|uniref:Alcohol dehydrogenase superfamily, zinc-type n=1 Tax=Akanthomyces lecanii RCEF 1005 TaxID=1081108 RepID=A0A168JE36_CORDF|nr:Alcohol dehydrogenase superfamily, zinc-type [Akanthomyces lecanii RCEF 1005]
MARQWILTGQEGFEKSLEFHENVKITPSNELGPKECLVRLHSASLNYRELVIAGPIGVNGPITPPVVPACDGAGTVEAVGASVSEFKAGDRVIVHQSPDLAEKEGNDSRPSLRDALSALGQVPDGTLRTHAVFKEAGLVRAPESLDWLEAGTLTCTWLTAWNLLFGVKGQEIRPGSWVLVQGTAGVSIAVLQLAVAAGATVVATTSSEAKGARLVKLGATRVVNYRTTVAWGAEARKCTPGGRGFDVVADIGGNETLPQSLAAVRVDGQVVVVGGVGEPNAQPVPAFSALLHTCILRGILGGSRNDLMAAVDFIDAKGIRPAVDGVVFELAEAKNAYRRLKEKKHFAKILIRID